MSNKEFETLQDIILDHFCEIRKWFTYIISERYIQPSIRLRNPSLIYKKAPVYKKRGIQNPEDKKIIEHIQARANNKESEYQYQLAMIYYLGFDTPDISKGVEHWLTQASEQNHVRADVVLGFLYYTGVNIPKNINKSIFHLQKAAQQNNNNLKTKIEDRAILGIYEQLKHISIPDSKNTIEYKIHTYNDHVLFWFLYIANKYDNSSLVKRINHPENLKYESPYFELDCIHDQANFLTKKDKQAINNLKKQTIKPTALITTKLKLAMIYYLELDIPDASKGAEYWLKQVINQENTSLQALRARCILVLMYHKRIIDNYKKTDVQKTLKCILNYLDQIQTYKTDKLQFPKITEIFLKSYKSLGLKT